MEHADTTGTPIYSFYPADNLDPSLIHSASAEEDPSIILPWSLESLPGTIWSNVHTGDSYIIAKIITNRFGETLPLEENGDFYRSIGIWRKGKFCIEHWVRIDHLPPSAQLLWYCFGINQLKLHNEKLKQYPSSQAMFLNYLEHLAILTAQAEMLVNQHNLPIPSVLHLIRTFNRKEISKEEDISTTAISVSMEELAEYSLKDISNFLEINKNGFLLNVSCRSIGSTQEPYDIAYDYLEALFVGEKLFSNCTKISANEIYEDQKHLHSVQFVCHPGNLVELAKTLASLAKLYSDTDEEDLVDMREEINAFQDELENKSLHFPALADNYLGNFIHSSTFPSLNEDISEEELDEYHVKYPEQKYKFWKSHISSSIGYRLFVSHFAWIVPLGQDVEDALVNYGGFASGVPDLHKATVLQIGNFAPLVFNKFCLVRYPSSQLEQTKKCAEAIYKEELAIDYQDQPLNKITEVFLDVEGQLLIASDQIAQYILFQDDLPKVSFREIKLILEQFTQFSSLIEDPVYVSCPWEKLNDNQFEELCYDVIELYYHPHKMRRMGKSRSRDGGRDIVFEIPGRLGKSPSTWIAQCKLIRNDDSLTSGKVEAIDTIYQYGANGFCVMTSGVIDSTLYDKLDGIARNAKQRGENILIETWSKINLEHFLARHLTIYKKYFSEEPPIVQARLL